MVGTRKETRPLTLKNKSYIQKVFLQMLIIYQYLRIKVSTFLLLWKKTTLPTARQVLSNVRCNTKIIILLRDELKPSVPKHFILEASALTWMKMEAEKAEEVPKWNAKEEIVKFFSYYIKSRTQVFTEWLVTRNFIVLFYFIVLV